MAVRTKLVPIPIGLTYAELYAWQDAHGVERGCPPPKRVWDRYKDDVVPEWYRAEFLGGVVEVPVQMELFR